LYCYAIITFYFIGGDDVNLNLPQMRGLRFGDTRSLWDSDDFRKEMDELREELQALQKELPVAPLCGAGHSLGEYSALVAAGALSLGDGVKLARKRGQFMQEAVPAGEGSMAALLGLDGPDVDDLCREHGGAEVVVAANYNGPGQVVISGHAAAVERVCRAAKERGARKTVPLPVSAPFHSPLLVPAGERLRPVLEAVQWSAPTFPVISNVDAVPYPSPAAIVDILTRQVSRPVRWEECMKVVAAKGAKLAVELGPKKVLVGLLKRIAPEIDAAQVEDSDGLRGLSQRLV